MKFYSCLVSITLIATTVTARAQTSEGFAIKDGRFIDKSIPDARPSRATLEADRGKVLVTIGKGESVGFVDGKDTLFGHGSVHTWIGKGNEVNVIYSPAMKRSPCSSRSTRTGVIFI